MARARKRSFEKDYVQIPNETAKAVESQKGENDNPISLEALGLLVNMWAYNVDEWDLHKTELYKRFVKNKRTSVSNAWKDLENANYIISFKYREGKRWEYVYYYNIIPYSEEQKQIILDESLEEFGEIWGVDFEHPKMGSPKWEAQNRHISNTKQTKDSIKEIKIKEKLTNSQKLVNKGTDPFTKIGLTNIANSYYQSMAKGRWNKKQWFVLIEKLVEELLDGEETFTKSDNPIGYIKGCLDNICYKHDFKKGRVEFNPNSESDIPFYNWLEDTGEHEYSKGDKNIGKRFEDLLEQKKEKLKRK